MTPREKVLAAINNHVLSDKTPIDLSGHRSSGIHALAYKKLRNFLGLQEKPIRIYDMVQQLAIVDDDILDMFNVDTIEMGRGFLKDEKDWKEWSLPDKTPCLIPYYVQIEKKNDDWIILSEEGIELGIQKKGCLYFEQTHFPLLARGIADYDFSNLEDILNKTMWTGVVHPGAHLPLNESGLAELTFHAKTLRESSDKAIIGLFGGSLFEIPHMLYKMENYLMFLVLFPDDVIRLSEKLCEIHLAKLEKWLTAVGPYIDVIVFGDDLGGQNGPLISPEMYRRYFKPYHQRLWIRAKDLADVKVMMHCCGGIRELMDDLIDAGLDAINPVQTNCTGMDPATLKEEFGQRITFWGGGCDTRDILPKATPEQVKKHVEEQVALLGPDKGFVFQQVHNIQADVPPENIVAMFEAVNNIHN
jgi:uroporphyrinogen decarboxylase